MESRIRHPHQRAMLTLAGLVGFALLATLVTWGLSAFDVIEIAFFWISFAFLVFFGLIFAITWIIGVFQVQRVKVFLSSERVLARWTYSTGEWQQLKESLWQEEKDDWKVQFGCLTFLLALAGLLAGILIGLPDGLGGALTNGLAGIMLGGLIGGALGMLVAGGNYWGARQAYRSPEPGQVALGVNEIFASDDYFKGDGVKSYIRAVKLLRGSPVTLEFQLVFPPRPRMPLEEQWLIPVPAKWVERVEEILPMLAPSLENLKTEFGHESDET